MAAQPQNPNHGSDSDPIDEWLFHLESVGPASDMVKLEPHGEVFTDFDALVVGEGIKYDSLVQELGTNEGEILKSCDFYVENVGLVQEFCEKGVLDCSAPESCVFDMNAEGFGNNGLVQEIAEKDCLSSKSFELDVKEVKKEEFGPEFDGKTADLNDTDLVMNEKETKDELDGGNRIGTNKGDEKSSSEESGEEASSDEEEDEEDESSSSSEEDSEESDSGGGGKDDEMEDEDFFLEEGEIMASGEEEDVVKGPIRSKHEVNVLPPVPKIEVQLDPHHQILLVGAISAIMGEKVVVNGSVKHNPLSEGSILWITEKRTPLGLVDELFGPVKNPYYLIRYNSEEEVPAGISVGTAVSYVPDFSNPILNLKELHTKGYDASGDNDEEQTDTEFSDDEKEAEYRKALRQAKRPTEYKQQGPQRPFGKRRQTNTKQHGPREPFAEKKGTQAKVAGFQQGNWPRLHNAAARGGLTQPGFPGSPMRPPVTDQEFHSLGAANFSRNAPTVVPPSPSDPAVALAVQHAAQTSSGFAGPSQHLFSQQPNAALPNAFPPQQYNAGTEANFAANVLQNLILGANRYHQLQNQHFGGFPDRMPSQQQFMPSNGNPTNLPLHGGQLVTPLGPPPLMPMGQGNFSQAPFGGNMQGQGPYPPNEQCFGQQLGGQRPPMQFNPGQFTAENSSFRGRGQHQRGGRHSFGRGGRPRNS